ncbi:Ferredoxin [Methylomagnum ishizawai]|uniref:Ferredoxin n=1 Tax=Methylomagnum ishizawai TaxID=1760988 RepID=A0A1Y6D5K7_9GAMM|nr:2Fe-2S iron-sulfur cluster-binding protein [Methylomagnum ishizawai]SMF97720.1 Ferredoxin [Methylomagnum ishizawai]
MAAITLLAQRQPGGTLERIQVRGRCPGRTLMDVIEQQGLRHRCVCRSGECGQCAVKVAILSREGAKRPQLHLGEAERKTLFAKGKLTRHQYASPILAYSAPIWRLACQYQVGEEDIVVAL